MQVLMKTIVFAAATCVATVAAADAVQDAVRSVMLPVLMQTPMPGGGVMPEALATAISECVLQNGSAQEISTLANAATTGPDVMTQLLIGQILQRPETTQCASAALGA